MRILILGGTKFLGRHLVESALSKGHEVTLFNRGQTNPHLFQGVEKLQGDRDGNLEALRGRRWDVVIDPSGYLPRVVRQSVKLLKEAVNHYIFVSSISVYDDFSQMTMDEDAPVGTLEDETNEDVGQFYGQLKALCEQEVLTELGDKALIIRPGLIVGPYDPTDRFTYWVHRFSKGGDILVPGKRQRAIQFIDARDLSEWMIRLAEERVSGVFNATGPQTKLTMDDFIQALKRTIPQNGKPVWVDEDFLVSKNISEFVELPLWISEQTGWPGFLSININRALKKGLTFRPLRETILDTLHWDKQRPDQEGLKAGLDPEKEMELLQDWTMWDK